MNLSSSSALARRVMMEETKGKLRSCGWLGRKGSLSGWAVRSGTDNSCSGWWMIAWLLGSEVRRGVLAAEERETRSGRRGGRVLVRSRRGGRSLVKSDGRRKPVERLGLAPGNPSASGPKTSAIWVRPQRLTPECPGQIPVLVLRQRRSTTCRRAIRTAL